MPTKLEVSGGSTCVDCDAIGINVP